ncbi:radical SAM/SPASM domain-containing protein [Candidatus Omnitrophota bacterium]
MTATIVFTTKCNLKCVYCPRSVSSYEESGIALDLDLDLTRFGEIIAALHKRKVLEVFVSGIGETTILKDWEKYCNRLLKEGFNLHIISNLAHKYTNEEIETLSRFGSVTLSCDTLDRELFKKIRKGADLAMVLDNFFRIKEAADKQKNKLKTIIYCIVLDKNIRQLKDFVRFWISAGIDVIRFLNLSLFCDINGRLEVKHPVTLPHDILKEGKDQLEAAIKIARDHGKTAICQPPLLDLINQKLDKPDLEVEYKAPRKGLTKICTHPWKSFTVNSDFRILPCCVRYKNPIGKLGEEPLDTILNGKNVQKLRLRLLKGDLDAVCKACPIIAWGTKKELEKIVRRHADIGER